MKAMASSIQLITKSAGAGTVHAKLAKKHQTKCARGRPQVQAAMYHVVACNNCQVPILLAGSRYLFGVITQTPRRTSWRTCLGLSPISLVVLFQLFPLLLLEGGQGVVLQSNCCLVSKVVSDNIP